jgi:hypothetical protein
VGDADRQRPVGVPPQARRAVARRVPAQRVGDEREVRRSIGGCGTVRAIVRMSLRQPTGAVQTRDRVVRAAAGVLRALTIPGARPRAP